MKSIVFLNSSKIVYDNKLDFLSITNVSALTKCNNSCNNEILERIEN